MRQIEFFDSEIAEVDRLIASSALGSAEIRRLMTVPGVNVIVAASFLAAIGDVDRFESPRKLVGYLGLDPRVRQSGSGPATHGRISKQGSLRARHALVEASWSRKAQPVKMGRRRHPTGAGPVLGSVRCPDMGANAVAAAERSRPGVIGLRDVSRSRAR
jgi:transposase